MPEGWTAAYAEAAAAWELRAAGRGTLEVTFAGVRPSIPVGEALLPLVVTAGAATERTTIPLYVLPPVDPLQPALAQALDARLRNPGAETCEVAISRRADEVLRSDLILTLRNVSEAPLVSGGWGPWPPTLTLVFPTADDPPGAPALTTPGRLDDIDVVLERGTGWRVVKRRPGPEWDIVAIPAGGRREVLGPGEELELAIRGLTTDFAPGTVNVELRSHGFPGFADDVRSFTVAKRATPMRVVEPLTVAAPAAGGVAELAWRVEYASHVQLSGVGEVPPASAGFAVPVRRDTVFVLTAYDALLGSVLFEQVSVAAGEAPEGPLPRGAILAWDGGPVPEGFALCDGSVDGVPDLSGRFIRGAGDGVRVGAGGGAQHGHDPIRMALAGELLATEHAHESPREWSETQLRAGSLDVPLTTGDVHATSAAEQHGHAFDALDVEVAFGASEPAAPRPPWHALTYIMKL